MPIYRVRWQETTYYDAFVEAEDEEEAEEYVLEGGDGNLLDDDVRVLSVDKEDD